MFQVFSLLSRKKALVRLQCKSNKYVDELSKLRELQTAMMILRGMTRREPSLMLKRFGVVGNSVRGIYPSAATAQSCPSSSATADKRTYSSLNKETSYNLCFLRHGQSTWNRDNRFIGWTDTPLTEDGVLEARLAGKMLAESGIQFDEIHTSLLRRSIRTVNMVLMEMGQEYLPVHKNWRLNERSYGDLVGSNKKETVRMYGEDQVKRWRRSFDEPPPPMSSDHQYHPKRDPRYQHVS